MRRAVVLILFAAGCGGGSFLPTEPDMAEPEIAVVVAASAPEPTPEPSVQPQRTPPPVTPRPKPTPSLCPTGLCLVGYTNSVPPRPICGACR